MVLCLGQVSEGGSEAEIRNGRVLFSGNAVPNEIVYRMKSRVTESQVAKQRLPFK